MNYPFWYIPHLGSGWVIGIFHVVISQFAVGGGFYLPIAERKALRMKDPELRAAWLKQLASHSKFFLVLTAVFGTVTGVGIWFAIGLTHPEATSTLIHNFVFGWAMEWVFFLVELTTIGGLLLAPGTVSTRSFISLSDGSTPEPPPRRSSSSMAFSLSCLRRETPGLLSPAQAPKPANSGTRSLIPHTGPAS
jgi:hypothetical protein